MRFKIDWASLIVGRKVPFLLCFTLYLRAISKDMPLEAYIWRSDLTEVFCVMSLRGLYLEGHIFGILRYLIYRFVNYSRKVTLGHLLLVLFKVIAKINLSLLLSFIVVGLVVEMFLRQEHIFNCLLVNF